MIARHRGDSRAHSRWRPSAPETSRPTSTAIEDEDLPSQQPDELFGDQHDPELPRTVQRKPRALIALATIVAISFLAGQQHTAAAPGRPPLPSTPQQWVSRWTAATLQSPTEVCATFTRPRSHAFQADTGHCCSWYCKSVKSTSFRIRHVLEDGPSAAVEAQQLSAGRRWGYFTVLLSHVHGGWQAVDVVPGGSVRAR